jgi:hypothetical protein
MSQLLIKIVAIGTNNFVLDFQFSFMMKQHFVPQVSILMGQQFA